MITRTWLRGLVVHRPGRLIGTAIGVAFGVALLAAIGVFLSSTAGKMTQRAVTQVPVDWQVEAQAGADSRAVLQTVSHQPGVERAAPVAFARAAGLTASRGGTTQQTGAGQVLGLPPAYARTFPGQVRVLAGRDTGVLLYQQTAANLRARPGDAVTIDLGHGHDRRVVVDGVVDLPAIDSLFQKVGAPPGAQPQAPPDNVVMLPRAQFDALAAPVAASVVSQVHARVSHRLPSSSAIAFAAVTASAHNLESRLVGAGLVGDNLATTLDSARQDALYAELLFLFLGLPGAILAGMVTASIAAAGADRRRQEAALLRTRGASTPRLFSSVEPLQHRYAYVGADLQDLYGVRPQTIGAAGKLQDSWFSGGTARRLIGTLAAHPDGVLVSAETVRDFQLQPGDRVNLRLQNGTTNAYRTVPFHYVGVVKEFPTAPRDSFFVTNASYVARATGSGAVGTFLIQTDGTSPTAVARRVASRIGASAKVTNIDQQRKIVGSNLTAVELTGLTRIELGFALVLAFAASGLALALGFQERRRTFALAGALGARPKQLGGFVWGESLYVTGAGVVLGVTLATALPGCS